MISLNFSKLLIRQKFLAVVLPLLFFALTTMTVFFIVTDRANERTETTQIVSEQSQAIADTLGPAMFSNDSMLLRYTLSKLTIIPNIDEAIVFNHIDELVTRYKAESFPEVHSLFLQLPNTETRWSNVSQGDIIFSDDGVHVFTEIVHRDRSLGTLYVRYRTDVFTVYGYAWHIAITLMVLVLITGLILRYTPILNWLQLPVTALNKAVKSLKADSHYDSPVPRFNRDELGELSEGFNELIAELFKRDQAVHRHEIELEIEVDERTKALQQSNINLEKTISALRQANQTIKISEENIRDAEESAEAKADFLANMSHEIMTPVNGIRGMLGLLKETNLKKDQRQYVDTAHESVTLLTGLLENSLNYSKLEKGIVELEEVPFNFVEAIEEVCAFLGEGALDKDVELFVQLDATVNPHVTGDIVRFKQLIFNLVGNAIKFTDQGHVAISYQIIDQDDEDRLLRFEIEDTGIGVSDKDKPNIFKRFYQVEQDYSKGYGGTGLGLALCKQLVKLMRGNIGVESEIGQGTTFWLELPFPQVVDADLPATQRVQDAAKHLLILLDKDPLSTEYTSSYFNYCGYQMMHANSYLSLYSLIEDLVASGQYLSGILVNLNIGDDVIQRVMMSEDVLCCVRREQIILIGSPKQRQALGDSRYEAAPFLFKPLQLKRISEISQLLFTDGQNTVKNVETVKKDHNILIVDDNKINLQVAAGRLQSMGYEADTAPSGPRALSMLQNKKYDLVFMDCNMPGMSGYEATQLIRESEAKSPHRTPVIAVTAHVMDDSRQRCFEAGMDDFIAKPFKTEALNGVLEYWLKSQRRTRKHGS